MRQEGSEAGNKRGQVFGCLGVGHGTCYFSPSN